MFAPRVVIVTMFEPEGERPGELALFRDRLDLEPIELAECGPLDMFANAETGVLAVVAGVGTANTAISMMALGMSDSLDLSESFWLICGIAGGNPNQCTLGSVVVSEWCVDGDLAFELDARDIPQEWETGILPLGAKEPYGTSAMSEGVFGRPYQVFRLNPAWVEWILEIGSELTLQDETVMAQCRERYSLYPNAQKEASLLKGDCLSAARFWHGDRSNIWAEKWVKYWTKGQGQFVVSSMEDTGTLQGLKYLEAIGRVNFQKVILIRGVSNFTVPPSGVSVIDNLVGEGEEEANYPGYLSALENANRVGVAVVDKVVSEAF